jgi:hypothetical protein
MTIITIGKRMIATDQIAFVEPFDPAANPEFKVERDFKARVVLLDRDIVLTETSPADFSAEHGLHLLAEDQVALNPAIAYKVELFEPTDSFRPAKPFKTRLKWNDGRGTDQSKLLLTAPEQVIRETLGVKPDTASSDKRPAQRPRRRRNASNPTGELRS